MKKAANLRPDREVPMKRTVSVATTLLAMVIATAASVTPAPETAFIAAHIVIPQIRAFPLATKPAEPPTLKVVKIDVDAVVHNDAAQARATTEVRVELSNTASAATNAECVIPVPRGAKVRQCVLEDSNSVVTTKPYRKADAATLLTAVANRVHDVAPYEFGGEDLVRTSPIHLAEHASATLSLTLEHPLASRPDRVDYLFPRSESPDLADTTWKVAVRIESATPVATAYAPLQAVQPTRISPTSLDVEMPQATGPVRLSFLLKSDQLAATFFAFPDAEGGGGYFAMVGAAPESSGVSHKPRDVTFVVDRSGSMRGEKLDQAKTAMRSAIASMRDGEAFNIVDYSSQVAAFARGPVARNAESLARAEAYIANLQSDGGTNLQEGLLTALRSAPIDGATPSVLFLTDGQPTEGETSEPAIRANARSANSFHRRIHTVGIGFDVNAPLLTAIAADADGSTTFVLPDEDVTAKIGDVFNQLSDDSLRDVRVEAAGGSGLIDSIQPARLPAVRAGDRFVVTGRYYGSDPIQVSVACELKGESRRFSLLLEPERASSRNAFVARLWAGRRIADLVQSVALVAPGEAGFSSERHEASREIAHLAVTFGIVAEYTSFLVDPAADLSSEDRLAVAVDNQLRNRAQGVRFGGGGVAQAVNLNRQRNVTFSNSRQGYLDDRMRGVEARDIAYAGDVTFVRRDGRWIDVQVLTRAKADAPPKADVTIDPASAEFKAMAKTLAERGRRGVFAFGDCMLFVNGKTACVAWPAKPAADERK